MEHTVKLCKDGREFLIHVVIPEKSLTKATNRPYCGSPVKASVYDMTSAEEKTQELLNTN